jgi:hypothetical protein
MQILPAWTDSAASVLASPVDSIAVYNEIWQDVEYPVSVVVEGMVAVPGYGSVQTQQSKSRAAWCASVPHAQ